MTNNKAIVLGVPRINCLSKYQSLWAAKKRGTSHMCQEVGCSPSAISEQERGVDGWKPSTDCRVLSFLANRQCLHNLLYLQENAMLQSADIKQLATTVASEVQNLYHAVPLTTIERRSQGGGVLLSLGTPPPLSHSRALVTETHR